MATVVITGYRELMRDLKGVETSLRKDTMREINRAAGEVRGLARTYLPDDPGMSGWDKSNYREGARWFERGYSARETRAGIQVKRGQSTLNRGGYRNEVGISNKTPAGMIYELAGSKSSGRTRSGRWFVARIASTGLPTPKRRVVLRAVIERGPQAAARIKAALDRAEAHFNRKQAR